MNFSSKSFSAELESSLETLLRNWKKTEKNSVKLSLHTLRAVLEKTESNACILPEVREKFSQNKYLLT